MPNLADCRTYVYAAGSSALGQTRATPSMPGWLARPGCRPQFCHQRANPFAPIVDGEKPGGQLAEDGKTGPFKVKISVRARCEVTPITDVGPDCQRTGRRSIETI